MLCVQVVSYHCLVNGPLGTIPTILKLYTPGLNFNVVKQMKEQSKVSEMPASKSYVTILLDEMKAKEDIVYDKHTGSMIGFVNLGSINDQLRQAAEKDVQETYHPPVADHILAVMVRGLFLNSH